MESRRQRLDKEAKQRGFTHRWKGKSRSPYLKLMDATHQTGATYVDEEQKFRFLKDVDVTEL